MYIKVCENQCHVCIPFMHVLQAMIDWQGTNIFYNFASVKIINSSNVTFTQVNYLLYHFIIQQSKCKKKGSETFLCPTFIAKFSLYRSFSYIQNPVVRLNWYSEGYLQPAVLLKSGHEYESRTLISLLIPIITHMLQVYFIYLFF